MILRVMFLVCSLAPAMAFGGTLIGHVRDQNWFAQYSGNPPGVGYYEFAVNANASNSLSTGAFTATDVFGAFSASSVAAGSYTVASWDVWWRSAYAFNVTVPAVGSSADVDLRLNATMWGYPAFWDSTGYHEFGQTFVATGPVTMIYVRAPFATSYQLTVRTNGPGGTQVGVARSFNGAGDHRVVFGYGEMPTVAGSMYYVRIRTSSPAISGVLMQMDPRPDFSDPMPNGCLWLGNGTTMTPHRDRDLGLVIMSDDDGLITDMFTRPGGTTYSSVSNIGQTFIARGVGLISAAFWLADPAAPVYEVKVYQGGPGGAQVGTAKRGKPARLTADPEMIVTWAPGECPLTVSQTYYVEVTRAGGGTFNVALANASNPFSHGTAYTNRIAIPGSDLAGTLMEEAAAGTAAMPKVGITADPAIAESNRGTNRVTIQWTTDVPSDSQVEWGAHAAFYTDLALRTNMVTTHVVTLSNLEAHTLYHYRVRSSAPGRKPATSRDITICTRPSAPNLLANPGFEQGSAATPNRPLVGWTKVGSVDVQESNGSWFWSMKPFSGNWLMQGAVNGGSSDGHVYQRVAVIPGQDYTFSAWVTTWPRENGTYKYDVWNNQGRLIYMWLGIDPTGGTNASAGTVQWTPRFYSHRRWSHVAKTAVATSTNLTVFIRMKGDGVEWHNYGVDECVLSHEVINPQFVAFGLEDGASFSAVLRTKTGRTNEIQSSMDFTNWQTIATLVSSNGVMQFTDTNTQPAWKFYRARER